MGGRILTECCFTLSNFQAMGNIFAVKKFKNNWAGEFSLEAPWGFPGGSVVKNLPANQETQV